MKLYLDVHNSVAMAERRRWRRQERRAWRARRKTLMLAWLRSCRDHFVTHQIARHYDDAATVAIPGGYRKVFR